MTPVRRWSWKASFDALYRQNIRKLAFPRLIGHTSLREGTPISMAPSADSKRTIDVYTWEERTGEGRSNARNRGECCAHFRRRGR